ncbi:MAG: hypothetical protein COA78_32575 [Blastopirellula sp.]|nr:MAG: hypothetical protein COA78_32575 [Blastopirellula sp.]
MVSETEVSSPRRIDSRKDRQGVFIVFAAILLVVLFAFASLAIDTGLISYEQSRLQNAVDAASLAASQELNAALLNAAEVQGDPDAAFATHARAMAARVAEANGVFIDPDTDVIFGNRSLNEASGEWEFDWNTSPYNVVKVVARRTEADLSLPDGRIPLNFGWAVGVESVALETSSIAFIEARDMVVVLDFSGSMNDDSQYKSIGKLPQADIEANNRDIYDALNPADGELDYTNQYLTIVGAPPTRNREPQIVVTFKNRKVYVESSKDLSNVVLEFSNGNRYKFDNLNQGKTGTFKGTGNNSNRKIAKLWVKSGRNASGEGSGYGERFEDTNAAVKAAFGLNGVPYPYNSGSWDSFINYCRDDSDPNKAGYRQMYGGMNLVNYVLDKKYHHDETEDLWKTPHYPFHAVKDSFSLFLTFLTEINYGDEVGVVSYDQNNRVEHSLDEHGEYVTLGGNYITNDYAKLDTIQRHKQAGHYGSYTGIGGGVEEARILLSGHSRSGAQPTIVLMTDGLANRYPDGWRLPGDWDWADYADFDGDGDADFSTDNRSKQYAFFQAVNASKDGAVVHTISVGAGADTTLMENIAAACGGIHVNVPGGSSIAALESQMRIAFSKIAAQVPPPQIVYDQ